VDSQIIAGTRLTGSRAAGICSLFVLCEGAILEASKWRNECGACGWVSHTHLRGSRETPPGPTTWVRPATGWWGRMNAGESPRNQGRSVWAPLSASRRRSRGLRKTPQWSAARRAGPRYGLAVPSRWRDRLCRKAGHGVRRSAPAPFGAPLPHACEGDLPSSARGRKCRRTPRLARTGAAELWLL
jgi:hypothetical protein